MGKVEVLRAQSFLGSSWVLVGKDLGRGSSVSERELARTYF